MLRIILEYCRMLQRKKKLKSLLLKAAFMLSLLAAALFLFRHYLSVTIAVIIIVIASLSKVYKHFIGFSVGFELVTFASIVFFYAYGFTLGIVLSLLMLSASTLLSSRFNQIFLFQGAIYIVIGILALFSHSLGIASAGKLLAVCYNIMLHGISLFLLNMPLSSSAITAAVNISTNFLAFDLLGNTLIELLQN